MPRFHTLTDFELLEEGSTRQALLDRAVEHLKERYKSLRQPLPEVRLIKGWLGHPGDFSLEEGKPLIRISEASNSWVMTLFHEFQHFLDWARDPSKWDEQLGEGESLENIDETYAERSALNDWNDFVKLLGREDLAIPGGQFPAYVRRRYGSAKR